MDPLTPLPQIATIKDYHDPTPFHGKFLSQDRRLSNMVGWRNRVGMTTMTRMIPASLPCADQSGLAGRGSWGTGVRVTKKT